MIMALHFKKLVCLIVFIFTTFLVLWKIRSSSYYYVSLIDMNDEKYKTAIISKDDLNDIENPENRLRQGLQSNRKVLVIVGIISAPSRQDRRESIRQTWMRVCKGKSKIVCRFFSDSLSTMDRELKRKMTEEQSKYKDIEFMSVPRGLNFGLRMLWLIDWSINNYDFEYLLRLDDDYLLCLEMLMKDLETRKTQR